jgi:hypothetical protein
MNFVRPFMAGLTLACVTLVPWAWSGCAKGSRRSPATHVDPAAADATVCIAGAGMCSQTTDCCSLLCIKGQCADPSPPRLERTTHAPIGAIPVRVRSMDARVHDSHGRTADPCSIPANCGTRTPDSCPICPSMSHGWKTGHDGSDVNQKAHHACFPHRRRRRT